MVLVRFKPELWRPTGFFQCFDTVGLVIWPVKIVPEMTYNVWSGTLNPTHSDSWPMSRSLLYAVMSMFHVRFSLHYWRSEIPDRCTVSFLAVVMQCDNIISVQFAMSPPHCLPGFSWLLILFNRPSEYMYRYSWPWSCVSNTRVFLSSQYLVTRVSKCWQRVALSYLVDKLREPADFEAQSRLRSASSSIASHPSYAVINRRWPSFSGCCGSCVEQSTAARHIHAVTASLPQSP